MSTSNILNLFDLNYIVCCQVYCIQIFQVPHGELSRKRKERIGRGRFLISWTIHRVNCRGFGQLSSSSILFLFQEAFVDENSSDRSDVCGCGYEYVYEYVLYIVVEIFVLYLFI